MKWKALVKLAVQLMLVVLDVYCASESRSKKRT